MKNDRKIHESRMSGAAWILEIAKRDGIEKAEEELKRRGAVFVPLEIPTKVLDEFSEKVKWNTIDTVMLLSASTLHDEFGFGHDRLARFLDRFIKKSECLGDPDCVKWNDYIEMMKEEVGIEFTIRENKEDIKA